jgi:hypothetical protein
MEAIHLFRRQFILSTQPELCFENWNNFEIEHQIYISVHPDLEITQSSFGKIQITLLGFVINPFEPLKSNQEVLDDLVLGTSDFSDTITKTEHLSGRWVLIYNDNNNLNLFHDPGGQRQVYYCQKKGHIMAGSDPAIINHFVKLELDTNTAITEFINSSNFRKTQNSWIGSDTLFKDVKHLMPNFFLNFKQAQAIRFWPNKPLKKIDLDTATELSSQILTGSLKAINKRQKLALAVTGGWDSRILLSASEDIHKDVCYFISVGENENINSPDVHISTKLFKQLNIPFYIQKCGTELEPTFKKTLEDSILMARVGLTKTNYIYQYFLEFDGFISVNGGMGEIVRTCIRPRIPIKITGANLVKLYCIDYDFLSYPIAQLDAWIDNIRDLCQENNINLFDMLYWEQRIGNWGALYPAEEDIAIDQFCPFNNRLLLTTMLSVDEKYRRYPDYILFYNIIKKLWPETLGEPLGVCDFKLNTRNQIKFLIRRLTGVY